MSWLSGKRCLVAIPTYDERENLPWVVAALRGVTEALPCQVDLLVIDDQSPDGTGELAEALAREDPGLKVLHRRGPRGLGRAYLDAFRYALAEGYDLVVEIDADLSHDPARLPALLAAAEQAELVLGSRYVRGGGTRRWGLARQLLSRGGSLYARLLLELPQRDLTGGYKVFRREALAALDLDAIRSEGYAFQIETTLRVARAGLRVVEVPIVFVDRQVGRSKMSGRIALEAVGMVWRLRRELPPS